MLGLERVLVDFQVLTRVARFVARMYSAEAGSGASVGTVLFRLGSCSPMLPHEVFSSSSLLSSLGLSDTKVCATLIH